MIENFAYYCDKNIPVNINAAFLKNIKNIGAHAFKYCDNIKCLDMLETNVIKIDDEAFSQCYNLSSIVLPNSIQSLGIASFIDCISLVDLNIEHCINLHSIGNNCFMHCKQLKHVFLPKSITNFGSGMFERCYGLKTIKLPDTLTDIPYNCFQDCLSLEEIYLPNNVKVINDGAFGYCINLKRVWIDNPDRLEYIGNEAFTMCKLLDNSNLINLNKCKYGYNVFGGYK